MTWVGMSRRRRTGDRVRPLASLVTCLVLTAGLLALVPAVPAVAAEAMSVTKTSSPNALVGGTAGVTLRATNTGDQPSYNLSFRDELPLGVTYVPGSTRPVTAGEPRVVTDPGTGVQTLVWENVSDLPVGASTSIDFQVDTDPDELPVGASFTNFANGFANSDPRRVPDFNAAGDFVGDATVQGTSGAAVTTITAVQVRKAEPSPESELLRGIHQHPTTYTLTVTNNGEFADDDVVLVDYLPAQLEFLGCGTVDNTSGGAVEYPGAPRLDVSTPNVPGCLAPVSVSTVTDPSGLPAGVYTRVEWDLGSLAPAEVVDVVYAAGIPQRANVADFPGIDPLPVLLGQIANLDNNTGASTRETGTEQTLTNHASVTADYTGPIDGGGPTQVGDETTHSVTAEDLAMRKSVSPGTFTAGDIATYTLRLRAGEYADAANIVITDQMPNGLCPLGGTGENFAAGNPPECEGSAGTAPSHPFTAGDHPDGSFTLTFDPVSLAADGTLTITYKARMLAAYRDVNGEPTVAGDSYTNTVSLTAQTTTLPSVNPPGGSSTVTVNDSSSATLVTDTLALDKLIQPDTTPMTCSTSAGDYQQSASLTAAQTTFSEGSRVCFLLRIDFPDGAETKNAVLTDFLPDYLDYETAVALPASDVTTSYNPATLTFTLGDLNGGNRFVPRGSTFLWRISGIVNDSAATTADVTGNLAKVQSTDSAGNVSFQRDREDFLVSPPPPVSVVKAANRVTAVPPGVTGPIADGASGTNQRIRAGDVVEFTVTTRNDGTAADGNDLDVVGPDVWDRLPRGITCAQVSAISGGGACTDPGDPGHPTFSDRTTRSAVRWDTADTVTIAPGSTLALTYRVTYPASIAAGRSYTNDVDVASYASSSNIGTLVPHFPATNVDTTVTPDQVDVPRAHDDHTLRAAAAGITKTNDTELSDVGQGSNPAGLNYAAVGETVTYVVTGTVPAATSIYNGVLYDTTPSGIRVDGVVAEYRAAPGDPYGPLPGTFTLTTPPAGPRVAFPASLDAGAEADSVRMTITATVLDAPVNVHGAVRSNTARLSSVNEFGAALGTVSASSAITVVEPSPAPLKEADDEEPGAGELVGYTVTARNANPADLAQVRPTLYGAVLVDCVPAGLTVAPASVAVSTGTATVEALGSNGCAADRTPVVWQVGDLAWRSVADAAGPAPWPTLSYDAEVSPAAAGGETYTNTATLTGTSMPGVDPDERSSSATVSETVTVPGGAVTKTVTPNRVPVGDLATYTVGVTIPPSVNFYDATLLDTLPVGISPASVVFTGSTCLYTDVAAGACTPVVDAGQALAPVGQVHGWGLGNVAADPRPRRITVTYTAVVGDVAGNTAGKVLTNTARVAWNLTDAPGTPGVADPFDKQSAPRPAVVTVTEPALTIVKTVSQPTPVPGEDFTYTVRVTNATGLNVSSAHGVDVVDTIPVGVRVVGTPSDGGVAAGGAPGGGTVTWSDLGPIAAGATVTLTYVGRLVSPPPTTAQVNVADITEYTSLPAGGGRVYDGPSDDATVSAGLPVLDVQKTVVDAPPAYLEEPTRWRISISNPGRATAFDVDVTDVLPELWTYDTGTATVSFAGGAAAPREPDAVSGSPVQTLSWDNLGDLAPGKTIVIVLSATPDAGLAPAQVGSTVAHVNESTATGQDLDGVAGSVVTTDSDTAQTRIDAVDLTMTKEPVGTPVAGDDFSWTLTVANTGPDTAVGPFVVTDDLPGEVTSASAAGTGWTCATLLDTLRCRRSNAGDTLADGASFPPITVTATVPADTAPGTTITNAATVDGRTYETDPPDNTDEVTVSVGTVADMGIDKALVGPLVPGAVATYRLIVRNAGPSYAYGPIVVTDTLPTGLTFDSYTGAGWTLVESGQDLTFTWDGTLPQPRGAMPQITIAARVDAGLTDPVTNTAHVSEPTDPVTGPEEPDTDSVTTTPTPLADLAITKESDGAFLAGTQGTYAMNVTNFGPSDSAGPLTVTDTLPDELTYVSVSSSDGWTCAASGQDLTCTHPDGLLAGDQTAYRVTVDIDAGLSGDIVNTATVSGPTTDPELGNNTDTDSTGILVEADLQIVKTVLTDPVVAGLDISYGLQVRNNGTAVAPPTTRVRDTLPVGLTFVDASGPGWSCGAVGRLVTCTLATALAPGESAELITVDATIASDVGTQQLLNLAAVDGPATDPVPGNNIDLALAAVTEDVEISVTKTVTSGDPTTAGEDVTFSVVVTNDGPSDALEVSADDVLPPGLTLVSASGSGWTCTDAFCRRDRIAAGASAPPLTIVATVGAGVPDGAVLENEVLVATATPGDLPAGNRDTADVTVAAIADLALEKSHATGIATAGLSTSFTIEVTNVGSSDAVASLTVVDTLPAGLTYLSAGAPWSCAAGPVDTVTCTLAEGLPAGSTAPVLDLEVFVAESVDVGTYENSATVSSPTTEVVTSNNTDTAEVVVDQLADVAITKTHVGPVRVGDDVTFTLGVTNAGPSEARDVVVTDTAPAGLTPVSADGTDWTCGVAGQVVTCTLAGALAAAGVAEPITVVATVEAEAYPSVDNVADVATSTTDVDLDNNEAVDTVVVPALVDLAVEKSHRARLVVGERATYDVVVSNLGPTPSPGPIVVTDTLPTGLDYRSASGPGWSCAAAGQTVTCTRAAGLAVDATSRIALVVDVLPSAYPEVVNTVTVGGPAEETRTDNNVATDPARVKPTVVLRIDKEVVDVDGRRVDYRITVTNDGPSTTVEPIRLHDPMPEGLRLVTVSGDGWSCTSSPARADCVYADPLAAGDAAVVRLVADVTADPGTEIVNVATVEGGDNGVLDDSAAVDVPGVDDNGGGGLPDAGGPSRWLLVLGLLLVLAGGGALVLGRRGAR